MIAFEPTMKEDEFWESENALLRARVLELPSVMAMNIEELKHRCDRLEKEIECLRNQLFRTQVVLGNKS